MTRWGFANTAHKWLNIPDEPCGRYNGHDCYWTALLVKPLLEDAKDLGQLDWWVEFGAPFQYAVLDMTQRGLGLDHQELLTYRKAVRGELAATDKSILAAADSAGFTYTD